MPPVKPTKSNSRNNAGHAPYQVGSSANRMRRLQERISLNGKSASVRLLQLMRDNKDKMTDEVRETMESLLLLPFANTKVLTDIDLLALYNYPLNGRVKQQQYNTLAWMMDKYSRTPGAGSLADVRLSSEGVVTGRPGFPAYTQKYMKAVEDKTGPNPNNARRHLVAWHTIRALMNLLIKNYDDQDAVVGMDTKEEEKKDDAELSISDKVKRVAQLLENISAPNVPDAVSKEADDKLQNMPKSPFGGHGDAGKIIFRSLFIMFGNPLNLWWGNLSANSRLPGIYNNTVDKMKNQKNQGELLTLASTWTSVEDNTINATAYLVAGMAINEANEKMPVGTSEQDAFNLMLEQANIALTLLEVDFQPASLFEAGELLREDRKDLILLGCQLHEQKIAMEQGRAFDEAKVMEFFTLMHRYPNPIADQSN